MTATISIFDAMFQAADPVLDTVFSKGMVYRRAGRQISIAAIKHWFDVEADESKGLTESWEGCAFEINSCELSIDGLKFRPESGDEIAEGTDAGFNVYRVLPLPKGKCWAPSDSEEEKLIVYAKFIREEKE